MVIGCSHEAIILDCFAIARNDVVNKRVTIITMRGTRKKQSRTGNKDFFLHSLHYCFTIFQWLVVLFICICIR